MIGAPPQGPQQALLSTLDLALPDTLRRAYALARDQSVLYLFPVEDVMLLLAQSPSALAYDFFRFGSMEHLLRGRLENPHTRNSGDLLARDIFRFTLRDRLELS
jgi:hypothetical protein